MGQNRTIVHLVRHGEVDNPAGLLYGRLPDYHLSELGREMAERVAEHFRDRDVVHVRSSPLERAQETAAPIAEALGLPVVVDGRLIEAANYFEGLRLSFDGALRHPKNWLYFRNPFRPSWGEAYTDILARMRPGIERCGRCRIGP
jgi:broad specificity phosphatase PhoE